MKKALCVLAVIAMVAVVSTSCNKDCTCKGTLNGEDWSHTYTKDQLNGVACSTMDAAWSMSVSDVKCK
ncbi:MAG: hypothetical protein LBL18_03625 [Bacteroidales bacterium]|jgi:predicted small secreted protein|nr:hypothetical protein [Bacteroidales bacterium]